MRFRLGPWVWRVAIRDGAIIDEHGEHAGRCVWADHLIEISGAIPVHRRLNVLLHELWHAWVFSLGRAQGDEHVANSVASFAAMVLHELPRQGGEAALLRMLPAGQTDASEDVRTQLWDEGGEVSGAECGGCQSRFAAGSIINSAPVFDPRFGRLTIIRALYCEHCSAVQEWIEGATNSGAPNGSILRAPIYRRGSEAAEFLRRNADKLRVFVT